VPFTIRREGAAGPIRTANESPQKGRPGSPEAAHSLEGFYPGWLLEKEDDQNSSSIWAFMSCYELQRSISILSALHLSLIYHELLSLLPVRLLKESWKKTL